MTEAPRFLRPVTGTANVGMAVTFDTPLALDCGRSLAPCIHPLQGATHLAR